MSNEEVLKKLELWAKTKLFIRKMWIYGSRARGSHKENSDLDIAIEIDGLKEETPYTTFFFNHKTWNEELNKIIPIRVHLEHYNSLKNSKVVNFVNKNNILVYTRQDITT